MAAELAVNPLRAAVATTELVNNAPDLVGPQPLPPLHYIRAYRPPNYIDPEFYDLTPILDNLGVIRALAPYLSSKDLWGFRGISREWNRAIIFDYPGLALKAQLGVKGKIREKWYKEAEDIDVNSTPAWNSLELTHFAYRRASTLFQHYWSNAASILRTLDIKRCSLECEGFIFILDRCPFLQSLNLEECKLRDLDDYHREPKRPRLAVLEDVEPIAQPIRHLSIKSVYKIEHCFMEYLTERTGNLESIAIVKCFVPRLDINNELQDQKLQQRADEFERNLIILLNRNAQTLRRYEVSENPDQTKLLQKLALGPAIRINELHLALVPNDTNQYPSVVRFMSNIQGLEKLVLDFKSEIRSGVVRDMLWNHRQTLRKFKLLFRGGMCERGFHLNFLHEFGNLEVFKIEDSKKILEARLRRVVGGRRVYKQVRNKLPNIDGILARNQTHLDSSFLGSLPLNLRELIIEKYMAPSNFLEQFTGTPAILESFRRLTKLEIRGPWVYPVNGVVTTISQELRNLESLALTFCGLNDMHMTELDEDAATDMRNCLTIGLDVLAPTRHTTVSAVENAMRRTSNVGRQRRRLSDLPNLKYLDLSKNHHISDVTVFDALRMPGIKKLNLDGCVRVSDVGLEFIPLLMPDIIQLNIKNCRKVSKDGLSRLITKCHKLKKVYATRTQERDVAGFEVDLNPNFRDIVSLTITPPAEEFEEDEHNEQ